MEVEPRGPGAAPAGSLRRRETADEPPAPPGIRAAAMPFILVTVLIDMVSIGLIIPVLPLIVGQFTSSPAEQTYWFGVVAFSFGLANFFGSPILGALSDRYGRRPVLLIGFSGLALSFFGTALATAMWMLIVVRLFSGAMQANVAVANAYVADITPPAERARRFGLLGAMFGLGFILGPVMGGLLGAVDIHLPFFAAGCLSVVNWLYGWFVLPESLPAERRRRFEWRRANPIASLVGLGRMAGVGSLVVVIGLASLSQFVMHSSWVLYTTFKFGWGPAQNGWSLFTVGVMSAFVQGYLLKHLLQRFTPRRLATVGLLASSLTYLGFGLAGQGWEMIVVIVVGTIFGAGAAAVIQSQVSNAADARTQGQTMGSVAALNSLMAVFAPVIGATLLGTVSNLPRGHWLIGLPFYLCALLQAVGTVIAMRFFARRARPTAEAA